WAGGPSCRADIADMLTLADFHTLLDALGKAFLVGIKGGDVVVVFDDDRIAVTPLPPGEFDDAVCSRADRCAAGSSVVDTIVPAPATVHGVTTSTECGADTSEFQGVAQEGALQAAALEVVIPAG